MWDDWRFDRDSEGSGRHLIEELHCQFRGGTEENYENCCDSRPRFESTSTSRIQIHCVTTTPSSSVSFSFCKGAYSNLACFRQSMTVSLHEWTGALLNYIPSKRWFNFRAIISTQDIVFCPEGGGNGLVRPITSHAQIKSAISDRTLSKRCYFREEVAFAVCNNFHCGRKRNCVQLSPRGPGYEVSCRLGRDMVQLYQHLGGTYCSHLQGKRVRQATTKKLNPLV
jgi:hypothetical protein